MNKKITVHDYFDSIPSILLDCQFIEECLKMYISTSYKIITRKLNESIPFKFSYADLKTDTLGTLTKKFRKFNNDQELLKKLGIARKYRNFLVHEAYLLTYEELKNEKYLSKAVKRLLNMKAEVKTCLAEVMEKLNKVEQIEKNL